MKKDRINTSSIREIKHSFKRFLSLLVMSMLGVLVFVGLKMAAPDMMKSLDKYYDDNNFYDIKIVSTLGLTNDDIKAFENLKTVKKAYGSYSKDVLVEAKNKELVVKLIGINQDINKIEILKGRMPKDNIEVIVEQSMINKEKLKIGDYITVNDDTIKNKRLNIKLDLCKDGNLIVDKKEFTKVVENLLTNAIKFTKGDKRIVIKTYVKDEYFYYEVYNSGDNINESDLKNIFNSYYKVKSTRNKNGTGLGLTIVKVVVDLHDGECFVKNTSDGVKFIIKIKK